MSKPVFTKDMDALSITVELVVSAPIKKVWEAWTKSEQMEQWWGPEDWPASTASFEFKVGGHWHYYMTGPDGTQSHGRFEYTQVTEPTSFLAKDMFCDEDGNINPDMPSMTFAVYLSEVDEGTNIKTVSTYESKEDMKKILEMGSEEGFTSSLQNLEAFLSKN